MSRTALKGTKTRFGRLFCRNSAAEICSSTYMVAANLVMLVGGLYVTFHVLNGF